MAVQTVPYALQNASHSAALFRQSASAPFLNGGALGSVELLVTQQGSPNMSVILGAGRAKVVGTSVSPPAGQSWTTQAMYDVLNDAAATLTIAASNPTNPRIDLVYIQVQDSFYSGAANQAIAGVVTGTPAASPSVPATPANAIAIATVAVAANATSIVNANIARVISTVTTVGGLYPTATPTTLAALQTAATLPNPSRVTVLSNGSEWYWNGSTFTLDNVPRVASAVARDALYVAPVAVATGDTVYRTDTKMTQTYDGTRWRYTTAAQVPIIPTSVVNGTLGAGGVVTFSAVTSVSLNGCFTAEFDNYVMVIDITTFSVSSFPTARLRLAGTDSSVTTYDYAISYHSGGVFALTAVNSTSSGALGPIGGTSYQVITDVLKPAIAVPTNFLLRNQSVPDTAVGVFASIGSMKHRTATAYDGVTVIPSGGGTMTGTIRVYGWNNN